jgi:uncharacterized protein with HEPN domain
MPPEVMSLVYDIHGAATKILRFTAGKSFGDYETDELLHSAVERQFEIVGEAMNVLRKRDSKLVDQITEWRSIISFRNLLIHGYAAIAHEKVWQTIQTNLPTLHQEIEAILQSEAP